MQNQKPENWVVVQKVTLDYQENIVQMVFECIASCGNIIISREMDEMDGSNTYISMNGGQFDQTKYEVLDNNLTKTLTLTGTFEAEELLQAMAAFKAQCDNFKNVVKQRKQEQEKKTDLSVVDNN